MLKERKFEKAIVEAAVLSPDSREMSYDPDLWYAFKAVGGKVMRVVVRGKKEPYTVVTVYFDRRLKP